MIYSKGSQGNLIAEVLHGKLLLLILTNRYLIVDDILRRKMNFFPCHAAPPWIDGSIFLQNLQHNHSRYGAIK
jgi:hypothetical protein